MYPRKPTSDICATIVSKRKTVDTLFCKPEFERLAVVGDDLELVTTDPKKIMRSSVSMKNYTHWPAFQKRQKEYSNELRQACGGTCLQNIKKLKVQG